MSASLLATVADLKSQHRQADFAFRAETDWTSGAENRTRLQRFYGAGGEGCQPRRFGCPCRTDAE